MKDLCQGKKIIKLCFKRNSRQAGESKEANTVGQVRSDGGLDQLGSRGGGDSFRIYF